jgi:diguanylate cyclase (GGDEF)-like protein/PAS domain S-box-containing protein
MEPSTSFELFPSWTARGDKLHQIRKALSAAIIILLVAGSDLGPSILGLEQTSLSWWYITAWTLSPFLAAVACYRVSRLLQARDRQAWCDFSLGCGLWCLGTIIWASYVLRGVPPPFPGAADACYLLTCLFFMTGMFRYGAVSPKVGRIQLCNFALVVCSVSITTLILLFHYLTVSQTDPLGTLIAFLYPALWFGTAMFGLLCFLLYASRERRWVLALVLAGVTAQAVADLFYGFAMMGVNYQIGSFFDGFWVLCFLLIVWAALEQNRQLTNKLSRTDPPLLPPWRRKAETFLPAATLALPLIAAIPVDIERDHPLYSAVSLLALVLVGLLSLREHWVLDAERQLQAIAEQRTSELSDSREQLSSVLNSTTDGVVVLDHNWRIIYMNQQANWLAGRGRTSFAVGANLWEVFPEEAGGVYRAQYQRAMETQMPVVFEAYLQGAEAWLDVHAYPSSTNLSLFFRDITERRRAQEQIQYLAHHDTLTGLPNRALFRQQLDAALTTVETGSPLALLYIDLDHFKEVNDTLGHPAGDAFLVEVAERLRACVREGDTVARLGGDEFAIIQPNLTNRQDAVALAQRLISIVSLPFEVHGEFVKAGASIGIAVSPKDGTNPDGLFKKADIALYAVKNSGRSSYRFFEPVMEQRVLARQALKADLADALPNNELHLVFQPIVDLRSNLISSFETLLRWQHPERGIVSPAEFIPVAEETGLILLIGEWVLEQACIEALKWPVGIRVAVNLSPCQFHSSDLPAKVAEILSRTGLPAERLELEVTESVLLQDSEANLTTLRRLRETGVRTALDDFGTGYSSLSYLEKFRFNKIKIDQSFISHLPEKSSKAIVKAITDLGHTLGMSVTAEGIETRQQLDKVRAKGCDSAQGYFFSRPVEANDVLELLDRLESQRIWWGGASSQETRYPRPRSPL